MRKYRVLLVQLLLPTVLLAATPKHHHMYVGAGLSAPVSSSSKAYNIGFHGTIGFGYDISPRFQILPRIQFHANKIRSDYWVNRFRLLNPAIDTVSGGTLVSLLAGLDTKLYASAADAPIRLYLLAGGGWANISTADFLLSTDIGTRSYGIDSQNKIYWNIGVGSDLGNATSITFFAELRYVNISGSGTSYNSIPLTVGFRF